MLCMATRLDFWHLGHVGSPKGQAAFLLSSVMPKVPLNRDQAWACILLNLSVPGWGSLKAGRAFAGIGEMVIVLTGLALIGTWMFEWISRIFQSELDNSVAPLPSAWLWKWGVGLVGLSCVWTIITCVGMILEARANEASLRQNPPPRLSDLPKPPKLG